MGSLPTTANLPANQTVVDLVAAAVNPAKLALTDPLWMGYL
jgi:transformation/transcription domain-associated protein